MIIMLPWWRAESLSSQRGNSSRILEGSIERPEMDQKCWSSYRDDIGGKSSSEESFRLS